MRDKTEAVETTSMMMDEHLPATLAMDEKRTRLLDL